MTRTQNTLETLPIGTVVRVAHRGDIVGTVVDHYANLEAVLIDFGLGRRGFNTPDQCEISERQMSQSLDFGEVTDPYDIYEMDSTETGEAND